jgi:hypothetical protein
VTPIENWLELEAGVSPFYTRESTEWDTAYFLKAVDHITEGRIHAWRRSRMGPPQTKWESDQLYLWGSDGRLHVLADPQAPFRLVPRTGLRLQFCQRPPAIHRDERWSPHRNSVIVTEHEPIVISRQAEALIEPFKSIGVSASGRKTGFSDK